MQHWNLARDYEIEVVHEHDGILTRKPGTIVYRPMACPGPCGSGFVHARI